MVSFIDFPKIEDLRGNLTFIQYPDQIPFEVKRVFWIYDVPGGARRGGHAYKTQTELIVALSGSFDVVIVDKEGRESKVILNRSYSGLLLPPNTWRHMENFSTNALSLHLSDSLFDMDDYVFNKELYLGNE